MRKRKPTPEEDHFLFGYEGHGEHWMEQPEEDQEGLDLARRAEPEEAAVAIDDNDEADGGEVVGDDDDGDGEIDDGLHYLNWKAK